jgi:hypothetical protein
MCLLTAMKTNNMQPIYESLNTINRSFERIIEELERLEQLDWFRGRPPMKSVERAVRETRAWTMSEILDVLHQREESQWMRFGRLRSAREKHLNVGVDAPVKPMRRKRRKISRA